MTEFKEYTKIKDYLGHRVRIIPTNFTRVQIRFQSEPIDVVYADVTVLSPFKSLGIVAIFQKMVVRQIKDAWVGRPIVGTLVETSDPHWPGHEVLCLDNVEVE